MTWILVALALVVCGALAYAQTMYHFTYSFPLCYWRKRKTTSRISIAMGLLGVGGLVGVIGGNALTGGEWGLLWRPLSYREYVDMLSHAYPDFPPDPE